MKKRYKRGLIVSVLTSASLLAASTGFAAFVGTHPDVPLLKWNTPGVPAAGTSAVLQDEPYSPRATCGACHNEVVDENTDDAALTDGNSAGSYDGGGATKTVAKTQGVENESDGSVEWVSFNTKAYKHGFVTGRHSQQGRNEEYGHHMREAVHGKYWANSPGMFGKY
ncbi:MAG: hypothetical protein K9K37_07175 [Desulfocapsa sp.]|nr:hypothetical protein [Desulfocapsa sp.]